MGFQKGLDVERRLVQNGGDGAGPLVKQFRENRAIHDFFNVVKSAGDIGSVEHAMVVDQLDDNAASDRVDRAMAAGVTSAEPPPNVEPLLKPHLSRGTAPADSHPTRDFAG